MPHPAITRFNQAHQELLDLLNNFPTPEPCDDDGGWRGDMTHVLLRNAPGRPDYLTMFLHLDQTPIQVTFNRREVDPPSWQQYARDLEALLNQ
jgi:hypothetical protein